MDTDNELEASPAMELFPEVIHSKRGEELQPLLATIKYVPVVRVGLAVQLLLIKAKLVELG